MISFEGSVAAVGFAIGLLFQLLAAFTKNRKVKLKTKGLKRQFNSAVSKLPICALLALNFVLSQILLAICFNRSGYEIALLAGLLGSLFGVGLYIAYCGALKYKPIGIYLCFTSMFHFLEYIATSIGHPESLHPTDSFMLSDREYIMAVLCCLTEYYLWLCFLPKMKEFKTLWVIGSLTCFVSDLFRKTAILTAGRSFHQLVQSEKSADHKLITHGVYAIVRHPAYVGWFYFSLGTQIILANPISFVLFAIINWIFFEERIFKEEGHLISFYGEEYVKYMNSTPSGLPLL